MFRKLLLLGIVAGVLAGLTSLIYQKVYTTSLGVDFSKNVMPAGIVIASVVGYYFTQFDTNLSIYPYLTNPGAPKWYGQQWGWPNTNTLDGYLGLAPPSIIGVSISGSMRSGSKLP